MWKVAWVGMPDKALRLSCRVSDSGGRGNCEIGSGVSSVVSSSAIRRFKQDLQWWPTAHSSSH